MVTIPKDIDKGDLKRIKNVLAKLRERRVKSLSDSELNRAFEGTVSPAINKRVVKKFKITITDVRNFK